MIYANALRHRIARIVHIQVFAERRPFHAEVGDRPVHVGGRPKADDRALYRQRTDRPIRVPSESDSVLRVR